MSMSTTTNAPTVQDVRGFLKPHAFGKTTEEVADEFNVTVDVANDVLTHAQDKNKVRKVGDNWRWSS